MRTILKASVAAAALGWIYPSSATPDSSLQQPAAITDNDSDLTGDHSSIGELTQIELYRRMYWAGKAEVIAHATTFSDAEQEAKFWNVYRTYEHELSELSQERGELIRAFSATEGVLSDEKAAELIERSFDSEEAALNLRRKYVKLVAKEVSPVVAAQFGQIESFVSKQAILQVEAQLPAVRAAATRTVKK